jgi:hypothetical protein
MSALHQAVHIADQSPAPQFHVVPTLMKGSRPSRAAARILGKLAWLSQTPIPAYWRVGDVPAAELPAIWGENPASSRVQSLLHAGISHFSQSWYLRAGVAGAAWLPPRAFPREIRVRAAFLQPQL